MCAKHVTSGGVTFEVSSPFFYFIYYRTPNVSELCPRCTVAIIIWPYIIIIFFVVTRHRCKLIVATRHCCLLCHVLHCFWCWIFHVFVGAVWCVRHPCFSWSSLFLAILLILPPLSPPNGAICWGTLHLSLFVVTAHHRNITKSQVRHVYSNLY